MKLLADAHISRSICEFLASLQHDCVHAEQVSPGMTDAAILGLATQENRVVLTADKDFGELIYRQRIPTVGVILLRFRAAAEIDRTNLFKSHWPAMEQAVPGHLVVATNRRVRRTPLPRQCDGHQ